MVHSIAPTPVTPASGAVGIEDRTGCSTILVRPMPVMKIQSSIEVGANSSEILDFEEFARSPSAVQRCSELIG